MKSTIHKWVLNTMTVPNPTQTTKLDKPSVKNPNIKKCQKSKLYVILHTVCYVLLLIPSCASASAEAVSFKASASELTLTSMASASAFA